MKTRFEIGAPEYCKSNLRAVLTILLSACMMASAVAAASKPKDEPSATAPASPTTTNDKPTRPQAEIISAALAQWSSKQLIMLYRQESATAPNRLDPLTQAATRELEHEFLNRQYNIKQPAPDVYRAMDKGPGVIISFAPDAGLSMIYSVYGNIRPQPGTDVGIAEVRIEARVFIGSNLLSVEQGRGQVQTRIDPALREYGERRGYEIASQRAAAELVGQIDSALKALSNEQIAQMIADDTTSSGFVVVEPPHAAPTPTPVAPPQSPPAVAPAAPTTPVPPPTPPATAVPDTPAPTVAARKWLLDVGVGDYSQVRKIGMSASDLPGSPTDVRNVHQTLQGLGFADANIIELLNGRATAGAVRGALDDLKTKVGPDDTVVFFISGHGSQGNYKRAGNTLPIFYDYTPNSNAPDFQEIVERLSNIPAKNLVMLIDTCHSGGASTETPTLLVSSRGVELTKVSGAPNLALITKTVKDSHSNIAIMTAARPQEGAWDKGEKVGGLFTYNVLMGLRSSRGSDTLQTLFERDVEPAVIKESRSICAQFTRDDCPTGQQTPTLGYSGAGNAIRLSDNGQSVADGKVSTHDEAGNTKESAKTLPTDKVATAEVDNGFNRWSTTWMVDRYRAGSARITERGFKDGAYVIRGLFDFARSGTNITIPFAAAYTKVNEEYRLSNLCYNDTSSGMTDCINPNASLDDRRAAAMQSSQFLGSIVMVGLVAAMSNADDEVCVKHYTLFGEPYFDCE